jgi:tetratricopeptide (TPR) repeat protein
VRQAWPIVVLLLACPTFADEPDRDLARTRFKAGQALFQRGRVAEALAEFEDGKKSFALPEFDYNIGLCLAKLDRPDEAGDALQRYIDAKPDDPEAAGIWRMIAELRAEASRRHQSKLRAEEELRQREAQTPVVAPVPPPVPPRDDGAAERRRALQTKLGIASAVVGGSMIVLSVLTGVDALSEKSNYDSSCTSFKGCNDSRYQEAHRLANATDAMIVLGAALVVTSIALFASRPKLARRVAWGLSF